jgi:hypothetical protein
MSRDPLEEPIGPNGESRRWMILASIRTGGFPHVAAAAYGVPAARFARWLRRGQAKGGPTKYRRLYAQVTEAVARARLKAEIGLYQSDPRFWLRYGPGRETSAAPGWTAATRPVYQTDAQRAEGLASPEFQVMVAELLRALGPYPEARAAAAVVLQGGRTSSA